MSQCKTILITGSSRGIGLLTAKALAIYGHRVYASMRDLHARNHAVAESLRSWAQAEHLFLEPIELDVTSEHSVEKAVSIIESNEPAERCCRRCAPDNRVLS